MQGREPRNGVEETKVPHTAINSHGQPDQVNNGACRSAGAWYVKWSSGVARMRRKMNPTSILRYHMYHVKH